MQSSNIEKNHFILTRVFLFRLLIKFIKLKIEIVQDVINILYYLKYS